MGAIVQALLCFLLIGGGATAWIYGVHLRREEARSGIMNFAGMHWRELQRLIVAALVRRGCQRRLAGDADRDGHVEMECDGQPWLLSTKHGAGYVLTDHAINEFANAMTLRGAAGGWMTTLGEVSSENRALARGFRIEVLDGRTLWAEIRPLLEAAQIAAIAGASRQRASRQLAIAWSVAALVGLLAFLRARAVADDADVAPTPRATVAAAPDNARAAQPAPPDPATGPDRPKPPEDAVPTDPAALAARRRQLIAAVGTLPWVDRAAWASQSTLTVYLAGDNQGDKRELCRLVERYDELRASRLQLQPPRGSANAVRFMQCRSY